MTTLTIMPTIEMSEKTLRRLLGVTHPKRLGSTCTLYDAGYETAKADLRRTLREVVGPVAFAQADAPDPAFKDWG